MFQRVEVASPQASNRTLEETLDSIVIKRPSPTTLYHPKHICLDKGYDCREIERAVIKRKYIPPHQAQRREPRWHREMSPAKEMGRGGKRVMAQSIPKAPP